MTDTTKEALREIYTNVKNTGSFGGVEKLFRAGKKKGLNITRKTVTNFLSSNHTYGMHKQKKKPKYASRVIVAEPFQQWQADLVDMNPKYKDSNNGARFILTVIDCFSKMGWARQLKSKKGLEVAKALEEVIQQAERPPLKLQTDKGAEFKNPACRSLYEKYFIRHFSSENPDTKSSVVERFNRTLKNIMMRYMNENQTYKWTDVLQDIVNTYNNTEHSAIDKAPNEVNFENVHEVAAALHHGAGRYKDMGSGMAARRKYYFKFKPGDYVRTIRAKSTFEKGYDANYTEEIFKIKKIVPNTVENKYYLEDLNGEPIKGAYYESELQKVSELPTDFRIQF